MKISIIAFGKARAPYKEMVDEYIKRISWKVSVVELNTTERTTKREEANMLLEKIPKKSFVIVLDEKGKHFGSMAFAEKIASQENVVFLLGSANGLDESVRQKADLILSLSNMTFPHMLARVMLAEQIYRAYTLQQNHPYHK